jgi:hypothetical protein
MSKSFFNTINLEGPALEKATARAATQEALVAAIFRNNPTRKFSPSQLQKLISAKYGRTAPITSWRRSLTNLTDRGTLTKCPKSDQVPGPFGLPENVWVYNEAGDTKALEGFMEDLQEGRLEGKEKCSEVSPQAEKATRQVTPPTPKGFIQQALFAY